MKPSSRDIGLVSAPRASRDVPKSNPVETIVSKIFFIYASLSGYCGVDRALGSSSQPLYLCLCLLVSKSTLYEDAALRSNSDTFSLTIVVGAANWLVDGRTLVHTGSDFLARVDIEVQFSLSQCRLLSGRGFGC